ncbi:MAG: protein phosphatase 2C domain-containing protein [Snowella sp.]|nr:protein phosphatase 2C domain-containing protein [Snowella sp.]
MSTLHCANSSCQTSNPLENTVCEACGTPLTKRYLWAVGEWINAFQVGELLEERYLLTAPRILLDTLPAQPPLGIEGIPKSIRPYLKLFPLRLHLPMVYSYLPSADPDINLDIWLLEYGQLPLNDQGDPLYPQLFPTIAAVWESVSPLRQLIWLKQMVDLWRPLQGQGVVSSLLNPDWIRVNGPNIQLLELSLDIHNYHTVRELMTVWSGLLATAHPSIGSFCENLAKKLEKGKIPHADSLSGLLETAIAELAPNYGYHYQVMTATDVGMRRSQNEDACYPPMKSLREGNHPAETLAIICDGIGGQDGGEIASQLAVDTLSQLLTPLFEETNQKSPQDWLKGINQVIAVTNDAICQRNDEEHREDRERMGTTLVMSFTQNHELFFGNLGDSRLYWITSTSCQQVTVDDDLASREVRLAYGLYRNVLQYPQAGALIQAVGMMESDKIQPAIERLLVDGDGLFLLCSDGLCDFDRIDQYWQTELLPILSGEIDLETGCDRLIQLANEKNGHDNVTFALIRCQVKPLTEEIPPLSFTEIEAKVPKLGGTEVLAEVPMEPPSDFSAPTLTPEETAPAPNPENQENAEMVQPEPVETDSAAPVQPRRAPFWQWAGLCLIIGGFVGYTVYQRFLQTPNPDPIPTPDPALTPPPPSTLPSPAIAPPDPNSAIPPTPPVPPPPIVPSPIPPSP